MNAFALGLAAMVACGAAHPAVAWTGEVVWPTFLRAQPGPRAAVTDELLRGTRVEVASCDEHWCRVLLDRATGFVDRTALAAMDAPPPPRGTSDCFDATRAGHAGGELWRYCVRDGNAAKPE